MLIRKSIYSYLKLSRFNFAVGKKHRDKFQIDY